MKKLKLTVPKKKNERSRDAIRVLIGTCPGSRQDAEALARAQIERYFDMPERSWLFLTEETGVGVHYEVHEGGEGRPLLPSLLSLTRETDEVVIIKPMNGHAVEVVTRQNRSLQSLVLPESQSHDLSTDERLQPAAKGMKPYATTGAEWIKVGVVAMSLGLLTITVAGVIHKSFDVALKGYNEIAENLPGTRLTQLTGQSPVPGQGLPALNTLPISQWKRISTQPLGPGESVSKLTYQDGNWNVEINKAPLAPDAPVAIPDAELTPERLMGQGGEIVDADAQAEPNGTDHDAVSKGDRRRDMRREGAVQSAHEMSHVGGAS